MTEHDAVIIVEESITEAEGGFSVSEEVLAIRGMTSPKIRALLNRIGSRVSTYLEFGLFRGATFLSAIEGNSNLNAVGVDNWTQFGGPRAEFASHFHGRQKGAKAEVFDMDCFSLNMLAELDERKPFEVFFYDGDHARGSQIKAVELYSKIMPDVGILIVDDWRKWGRTPTLHAIHDDLSLETVKMWELSKEDGWWEGVGILLLRKIRG